jgi:hypothetical protein
VPRAQGLATRPGARYNLDRRGELAVSAANSVRWRVALVCGVLKALNEVITPAWALKKRAEAARFYFDRPRRTAKRPLETEVSGRRYALNCEERESAQAAEEAADIFDKLFWLLHGGEVAATLEGRPSNDVVKATRFRRQRNLVVSGKLRDSGGDS